MKKRKIRSAAVTASLILLFLAGLSLVLYPSVSNFLNTVRQTKVISHYSETVGEIGSAEYERMLGDAGKYNEKLRKNGWGGGGKEYGDLLNVDGNGMIGYIEIKKIGVTLPIYHGTSDSVLAGAAGHLEGTGLPVGGEGNHAVLSGHRGLPGARLFTDLDKLEVGDVFVIRVLNEVLTYRVERDPFAVEPTDTKDLMPEDGRDLCTLLTCTPYGVNTQRLLVRGSRIPNGEDASGVRITSEAVTAKPLAVAPFILVPILLIILAAAWIQSAVNTKKNTPRRRVMNMTKTKTVSERLICLILLCFAALSVLRAPVRAGDGGVDADCGLAVDFHDRETGKPLTGAVFDAYRVGDTDGTAEWTLSGSFRDAPADPDPEDPDSWQACAGTLAAEAMKKGISPYLTLTVGGDGLASATVKSGVYLLVGRSFTSDGSTYETKPFLVILPYQNRFEGGGVAAGDEPRYSVISTPKYVRRDAPGGSVTKEVVVRWDDEGISGDRPEKVTVFLYKNGVLYDTATVGPENGWKFVWFGLDPAGEYAVSEEKVDFYLTEYETDGDTFIITNIRRPSRDDVPGVPPIQPTGLLWWPVPAFAAVGIALCAAGLTVRRAKSREDSR